MTIVNHILRQMPAVSQPQRKFLDTLFVTVLALRGRVNFRNLSRYCDYSERTMARQFQASFDWSDFHQRVMVAALDSEAELISVQDASFIPKSGKQTYGLGHFFNGCRRAERGWRFRRWRWWSHAVRFHPPCAQTPPGGPNAFQAERPEVISTSIARGRA